MGTQTIDLEKERPDLWKLLARLLETGDEFLLVDGGRPIARLIPAGRPSPGVDYGKIEIGPDFDDPLPEFDDL